MAAFAPVATGPAADVPATDEDIVLRPGTSELAVTAANPVVVSGGAGTAPASVLDVTAPVPAVLSGALVTPPVAEIFLTAPTPYPSISATTSAPATELTVDAPAPVVLSGATGEPPVAGVILTAPPPVSGSGVRRDPPAAELVVTAPMPMQTAGKRSDPPAAVLIVEAPLPTTLTGQYVEASNTVSIESDNGSAAGGPAADSAPTVGENLQKFIRVPPTLELTAPSPSVVAGKSAFPPAAQIILSGPSPEVHARRAKLKVLAIAS
jgi:hypothetical protein